MNSRNLQVVRVGARAIDVGYYNTKYSLGRSVDAGQAIIATGLMPSLAGLKLRAGSPDFQKTT